LPAFFGVKLISGKDAMNFRRQIPDGMFGMCIGAALGAVAGVFIAGIGGALLGLLIGGWLGFSVIGEIASFAEGMGIAGFALVAGAVALLIWLIHALWDLGRP
jgi:hypothetical protein